MYQNLYTYSDTGELTINLNSAVGDWWSANDKQSITDALLTANPKTVTLNISSLGGNVDDALAIHDALRNSPATVTANLTGFVASAATIVALAADKVRMSENAFFLVHKPWVYAEGNADALRSEANNLDSIETALINIYKSKTGKRTPTLQKLMQEERWLSATEAKDLGFIDEIYKPAPSAAGTPQNSIKLPPQYPTPPTKMQNQTPETILSKIRALFVETPHNAKQEPDAKPETPAKPITTEPEPDAEALAIQNQLKTQQEELLAMQAQLAKLAKEPAANITITEPETQKPAMKTKQNNAAAFGFEYREVPVKGGKTATRLVKEKTPAALNQLEAYYMKKQGRGFVRNDIPVSLSNIDFDDLHNEFGACTAEVMQEMMRDIFIPSVPEAIVTGFGYKKDTTYSNIVATIGEVLQPWACDWNSKGAIGFTPYSNTVRALKADYDLCPGDIYRTYFNYLASNGFTPYDHPFVDFIIEMLLAGMARDNRMKTMFFGDYNAAGTAALDAYDGFHTIIDDAITASTITPVTTGAFTWAALGDALDYIDTFAASFPAEWNSETIHILANHTFVKQYAKDHYITYNVGGFTRPEATGDSPVQVFGTNWLLYPVHGIGTGDRLIAIRPGNFAFLMDTIDGFDQATVEKYRRKISIMIDAVGSAAINSLDPTWIQVNDQTNTL